MSRPWGTKAAGAVGFRGARAVEEREGTDRRVGVSRT
eukprot:COSAG01_NODE_27185_length_692_cov_0.748735_2_plen_36_part_01